MIKLTSFRPERSAVEEPCAFGSTYRDQPSHFFSAWRIVDFRAAISLPIKTNWVSLNSNGSKSQRPATKLKSCEESSKRTKPFARYTLAGRLSAKRSKQLRENFLSEVNVKDSNSG